MGNVHASGKLSVIFPMRIGKYWRIAIGAHPAQAFGLKATVQQHIEDGGEPSQHLKEEKVRLGRS